jgi:hypothetical protein
MGEQFIAPEIFGFSPSAAYPSALEEELSSGAERPFDRALTPTCLPKMGGADRAQCESQPSDASSVSLDSSLERILHRTERHSIPTKSPVSATFMGRAGNEP